MDYFLNKDLFWILLKYESKAPIWMNIGGIDAEKCKESENPDQNSIQFLNFILLFVTQDFLTFLLKIIICLKISLNVLRFL